MIGGLDTYIFLLLEHKSYADRLIHLQLLEYMLKIWRYILRQEKCGHLPVIIPMVLYHGRKRWQYGIRFSSLFPKNSEKLGAYIPDFGFILRDLTRYSDDEISGLVIYRSVMLLFRHIHDPDIALRLPGIFSVMREVVESEGGLRFLEKILRYLCSAAEEITPDRLKDMVRESISREKGEFVMTIAEVLRKEGFDRGIQEGIQRGIQEGLQQGMQQGLRQGICEAVEALLSLRFGDEGVRTVMPMISHIQDCDRLRTVKNAIKTVKDISELKAIIGN
jgi:predicted transposase/invertase (TIGR01784 family)